MDRVRSLTGIGLRFRHFPELLERSAQVNWFEVHSENFFVEDSPSVARLLDVRADYDISLHGIGLSLGSACGIDAEYLARLARLAYLVNPVRISDHLCWTRTAQRHWNDLLPLPLTDESLEIVCRNVDQVQSTLKRPLVIENISAYLTFNNNEWDEPAFMAELVRRTGCELLLDVNNVYVNACNQGFAAEAYIDQFPMAAVREIHLAGFDKVDDYLIDTHGQPVSEPVWELFQYAILRCPDAPALIEWDTDVPPLDTLEQLAQNADRVRAEAFCEHKHHTSMDND